ncbi:MAG TPA: hypothetical protein VK709_16165 [Candidatus Saccharimonadales bacterium]|jgi:hypothetical protein|nr:hypothetical protein [Candidatus Saccharimonadales bacterium]
MRIREYTDGDFDDLRRMHAAQGFGYPLPDLDSPLFVSKLVLEDDEEDISTDASGTMSATGDCADTVSCAEKPKIAMAVLLRLTAEAYLLHDSAAGTPRSRWHNFIALHDAARASAAARGLDDVQAFLPPRVARAFGRRLSRLGWTRDPWDCFSQRV